MDDTIVQCSISSKLRKHLEYWWDVSQSADVHKRVKQVHDIREVDPIAIGDRVRFVDAPGDDQAGMIVEVLPRRNAFFRPAAGPKPLKQVIAANIDQMMPVFAARQPNPKWRQLDRYIAAAEFAGVQTVICINKIDLARKSDDVQAIAAIYERIGYRVLLTSAVTGEGIDIFVKTLQGRVTTLTGRSGVGKTSLLNAVQPDLGLRVNEVSQATGKGKHTTSQLAMFSIDGGGGIIDTPGMREFEIRHEHTEGGLASLFIEMRPLIGQCRFGLSCEHWHEPDCAIKAAVETGEITQMRYDSYVHMLRHIRRKQP
jgi:ribosome biogenesis GTPase